MWFTEVETVDNPYMTGPWCFSEDLVTPRSNYADNALNWMKSHMLCSKYPNRNSQMCKSVYVELAPIRSSWPL